MRKFLFFSYLLGTITLASCQSTTTNTGENGDIPIDIVFDQWNIEFGMVKSIDVTLKGKNKSGETVEVKARLGVNQYDEFLLPMLAKLEEEEQIKNGNTGSGILKINSESANGNLYIEQVGNVAAQDMEFRLNEEEVAAFMQ